MKLIRILTFITLALYMTSYDYALIPIPGKFPEGKRFTVTEGEPFYRVALRLKEEGVIRDYRGFVVLGWWLGASRVIKAGEYEFKRERTAYEILDKLIRGDVVVYRVTIPEGSSLFDIAHLLEKEGLTSSERFLAKATDPELLKELGVEGVSAEGYLFPDTYLLTRGFGEEMIIRMMVARFRRVFTEALALRAKELKMTEGEVITLASLIEKEAAVEWERPIISAVFHNRLKRGMKLQSDPSAVYELTGFKGRISWVHLKRKSEYNTYYVAGLPPGPIANPGRSSMLAALYPAKVNYLYFVSKNDGTHHFSTSLEEHNRAVARYQRADGG